MKPLLLTLFFLYFIPNLKGQTRYSIDTINISKDTNSVKKLLRMAESVSFANPEEGKLFAKKAIEIAKQINYKKGEADALTTYAEAFHFSSDYPTALKIQFDAVQLYKEIKDSFGLAGAFGLIGILYNDLQQYHQALEYLKPAATFFEQENGTYRGSFELANIADAYLGLKMNDSALYYEHKAFALYSTKDSTSPHLKEFLLGSIGEVYAESGKTDSALIFYKQCVSISKALNDKLNLTKTQVRVATLYDNLHQYDSAFVYAKAAFDNSNILDFLLMRLEVSNLLSKMYQEKQNKDSALFYLTIASAMRDSLYGPDKIRRLQLLALDEQQKQQEILIEKEKLRNKIKYTILFSSLIVFLLIAFLLYRNNLHKQKANKLLQQQKQKVESTLSELKSTQAQLIQSAKMASLGELTAGIAHEIQNPLNFVNNFSEVNKEMLEELKAERLKPNAERDEVLQDELINDVIDNSEKINHHGKRAGDIVKGMLQHSRKTSGQKEPTDINALADEYLRLSYHGLRAKDKTFNAEMKTDFDGTIGKINVIPQDIGRVLLNLFNNAFYAVNEQKTRNPELYKPTVSVTTMKCDDKVQIIVKDNGNGIPQNIVDKIFQPFFTTKPTGQGTGLGLSLAYDIIKAHGGSLKVESKEGEGSEFVIQLPVT
jgi:two-component system, NtrC family, sensor kinase